MSKYHPNKEIRQAIEYAIEQGWRFEMGGSHCFGQIYCSFRQRGGCRKSVDSTPRNAHKSCTAIDSIYQ